MPHVSRTYPVCIPHISRMYTVFIPCVSRMMYPVCIPFRMNPISYVSHPMCIPSRVYPCVSRSCPVHIPCIPRVYPVCIPCISRLHPVHTPLMAGLLRVFGVWSAGRFTFLPTISSVSAASERCARRCQAGRALGRTANHGLDWAGRLDWVRLGSDVGNQASKVRSVRR